MAHFFVDKFNLQYFSDGTLNFDTKVDTDGLNEGTDEVGSKFGKLGSIFETGLGVLTGNLMTEAVGKLQELGASVVDAGADYEQLVGGVQKLYGNMGQSVEEYAEAQGKSVAEVKDDWQALEDAQNKALENANNAYKTSGMSMNDYMETATSFSAALINSLGGDTMKAAEQTDVAMQAISDNVNTFGSDAEAVKNAFMGFSKANYTMLDNLKLGYGGTKTEMERLIADANEYAATIGESSDLSIDSFSDIVTAIQLVQEKQNIAGTTAREAASTYSGSLAMLQASWENVLTAIGSGENMQSAVSGLAESLVAYGSNAVKMLSTIVEQVPAFISTAVSTLISMLMENSGKIAEVGTQLMTSFSTALSTTIPEMLTKGTEIVTKIVEGITTNLPQVQQKASEMLSQFLNTITTSLPNILQKGVELVTQLVNGFIATIPTLMVAAGDMISQFLGFIMQNLPSILSAGVSLLTNIVNGIINNLPQIAAAAVKVVLQLASTIVSNLPTILAKGIEIIIKLVAGIIQAIPRVIAAVPQIIRAITSTLGSFDWWSVGKNIIQGIVNGVKSVAGALKEAILDIARSALDSVKRFFGIASPSKVMAKQVGRFLPLGIAQGIEGETDEAVKAMEDSASKIEGAAQITPSSIISGARSAVGNAASTLTQGISEKMTTINVPLYIDGREFARAEAPYLNKQLAWEA